MSWVQFLSFVHRYCVLSCNFWVSPALHWLVYSGEKEVGRRGWEGRRGGKEGGEKEVKKKARTCRKRRVGRSAVLKLGLQDDR